MPAGRDLTRMPANARLLLPVVGQATAGIEFLAIERDARVVADHFGDQVCDIDRAIEAARALGRRFRHCRRSYVETRAAARLDVTRRDEPIVGLDDGEAADPLRCGERANRRQARARPQEPGFDMLANAGHDLLDERLAGIGAKSADSASSGSVRRP